VLHRAAAYHERGKLDLALAEYTKAIELNPENHFAYFSRARVYFDRAICKTPSTT